MSQPKSSLDDTDAVRLVLEEKEKDLELAAKIGQTLLERNRELQFRNEFLEEQTTSANEQLTQLRHELQWKIDLLHIYTDTSEVDSASGTPGNASEDIDSLQKKLKTVEEENCLLKMEAGNLKSQNYDFEEKEQNLVSDCLKQLNNANRQVAALSEDVAAKGVECHKNQSEITALLQQLVQQQTSNRKMLLENEDLIMQLEAAQDTQNELSLELMDLQERYAEVLAMLHEAREELKMSRQKQADMSSAYDSVYDSLASELEASDSSYGPPAGPSAAGQWPSGPPARCKANQLVHSGPTNGSGAPSARQKDEALQQSGTHIAKVMDVVRLSEASAITTSTARARCEQSVQTLLSAFDQYSLFQAPYFNDSGSVTEGRATDLSPRQRGARPSTLVTERGTLRSGEKSETVLFCEPDRAVSAADGLMEGSPKNSGRGVVGLHNGMEAFGFTGLRRAPSSESLYSFYDTPEPGVPGIPGSRDLEIAVRRLNLRRHVNQAYKAQRLQRLAELGATNGTLEGETPAAKHPNPLAEKENVTPSVLAAPPINDFGDVSPIASGKRSICMDSGLGSARVPAGVTTPISSTPRSYSARLDIVKSTRGSPLLEKWRTLATPSITRSLVPVPGVRVRSQRQSPPNNLQSTSIVEPNVSMTVQLRPAALPSYSFPKQRNNGFPMGNDESWDWLLSHGRGILSSPSMPNIGVSTGCSNTFASVMPPDADVGTMPTYSSNIDNCSNRRRHKIEAAAHLGEDLDEMWDGGVRNGWPIPGTAMEEEVGSDGPSNPVSSFTKLRQNPTSTYSMTLGLAKALNERAVDLVSANPWATPTRQSCMTTTPETIAENGRGDGSGCGIKNVSSNTLPQLPLMDKKGGAEEINDSNAQNKQRIGTTTTTAICEQGTPVRSGLGLALASASIPISSTNATASSTTTPTLAAYSTSTVTSSAQQGALIKVSSDTVLALGELSDMTVGFTAVQNISCSSQNRAPTSSCHQVMSSVIGKSGIDPASMMPSGDIRSVGQPTDFGLGLMCGDSAGSTTNYQQSSFVGDNIQLPLSQRSSLLSILGPSVDNNTSALDAGDIANRKTCNTYTSKPNISHNSYNAEFQSASQRFSELLHQCASSGNPSRASLCSSSKQSRRSSDLAIFSSASSLSAAGTSKDNRSFPVYLSEDKASSSTQIASVSTLQPDSGNNNDIIQLADKQSRTNPPDDINSNTNSSQPAISYSSRRKESALPVPKSLTGLGLTRKPVETSSRSISEITVTPKRKNGGDNESDLHLEGRPNNAAANQLPSPPLSCTSCDFGIKGLIGRRFGSTSDLQPAEVGLQGLVDDLPEAGVPSFGAHNETISNYIEPSPIQPSFGLACRDSQSNDQQKTVGGVTSNAKQSLSFTDSPLASGCQMFAIHNRSPSIFGKMAAVPPGVITRANLGGINISKPLKPHAAPPVTPKITPNRSKTLTPGKTDISSTVYNKLAPSGSQSTPSGAATIPAGLPNTPQRVGGGGKSRTATIKEHEGSEL